MIIILMIIYNYFLVIIRNLILLEKSYYWKKFIREKFLKFIIWKKIRFFVSINDVIYRIVF